MSNLPIVRIHENTPMSCVIGKIKFTKSHGLVVIREGVIYKVEIIGRNTYSLETFTQLLKTEIEQIKVDPQHPGLSDEQIEQAKIQTLKKYRRLQ